MVDKFDIIAIGCLLVFAICISALFVFMFDILRASLYPCALDHKFDYYSLKPIELHREINNQKLLAGVMQRHCLNLFGNYYDPNNEYEIVNCINHERSCKEGKGDWYNCSYKFCDYKVQGILFPNYNEDL